jgi:hypothetical protein
MSIIKIQSDVVNSGIFTISSPASNDEHTLTLPDVTTTAMGNSAVQTLTNKTFGTGLVMAASTLTSAGQITAGGTSNILATNIPPWVESVSVMFSQLSSTGTSPFLIQFGTGSPPTYVTTGYQSVSDNYQSAVSPATATNGFRVGRSIPSTSSATAIYTFFLVGTNKWIGQLNGILDTGTSVVFGGGFVTLSSALTAVRFTTSGGTDTFDTGTLAVWYE